MTTTTPDIIAMRAAMPLWSVYESPLGPLTLLSEDGRLTGIRFPGPGGPDVAPEQHAPEALAGATEQLEQYFAGEREAFDLPLTLHGTEFQRSVWNLLLQIPYGSTTTYGTLAAELGRPDRVRAVGGAVGRTPVPIVVPCHRVIGADGSLTGYGGGLDRKAALLGLEGSRLTLL